MHCWQAIKKIDLNHHLTNLILISDGEWFVGTAGSFTGFRTGPSKLIRFYIILICWSILNYAFNNLGLLMEQQAIPMGDQSFIILSLNSLALNLPNLFKFSPL